jgi:hypothetical protein
MATSSLPIRPITKWKRIAIVSLFGGFGIALAVAALFASVLWYSNRPKQWDAQAIRAHYNQSDSFVTLEEWYQKELKSRDLGQPQKAQPKAPGGWIDYLGNMTIQISYDLENSTNSDYPLEPPAASGVIPMQAKAKWDIDRWKGAQVGGR